MQRYNRLTRWFHAGTYLLTFVLLGTGWWLWRGEEGNPSFLARWADTSDIELHKDTGWVLVGFLAVGVVVGVRATWTFLRETVRVDRGDGRWLRRWPAGVFTGRFGHHRGHFDPGQRLANVVFVVTIGVALGTGIALTELQGGDTYVWTLRFHRWSTYALTAMVVGHVVVALGVLPGYRGVWRAMHWRGRIPEDTARRVWPESVDRDRLVDSTSGRRDGQ